MDLTGEDVKPRSRLRGASWGWYLGLVLLFLVAVQLVLLKRLPYASCWIEKAGSCQDPGAASADFSLGNLRWDVRSYARDPRLRAFREYYQGCCAGQKGVEAATLIGKRLAADFPFGEPSREFFNRQYDPAADFRNHLRGEPGHCVTYAGFLAATLLSAGIPARVVQLIPRDRKGGHNLVEVWDDKAGWVLVDPSYGCLMENQDGPCSGAQALRSPAAVWFFTYQHRGVPGDAASYYRSPDHPLDRAVLMYPEPWLYLRTGPRASFWPYRGCFVLVGNTTWKLGPAQTTLQLGIAACGAAGLTCLAFFFLRRHPAAPRR